MTWLVHGTSTFLTAELKPQKREFHRMEIYPSHIKANFHLDKMSVNTPINFFILWPFHLFLWASYLMTQDPGLSNICCSIVNYTTITNGIMLKVACYMSFIFTSFINGVEPNFLDECFCILDNQNLYHGCPKDKRITKFFSYSVINYSQTRSSVPPKNTLMNLLFKSWIRC